LLVWSKGVGMRAGAMAVSGVVGSAWGKGARVEGAGGVADSERHGDATHKRGPSSERGPSWEWTFALGAAIVGFLARAGAWRRFDAAKHGE
jgi:hypothetical protein